MRSFISLVKIALVIFSLNLVLQSCIIDEFRIDEIDTINMEKDWGMDIVSPFFTGEFEFKDLIFDDDSFKIYGNDHISVLKFPDNTTIPIPTRIVFEPSTVIDSLDFLIEGNYSLHGIKLEYQVENGSPFPFNFQMRFFDADDPKKSFDPILPPSFQPAKRIENKFVPVLTEQTIGLTDEQSYKFTKSNRIEISTWFEPSEVINKQDTFMSNYPVKISMLLFGEIKKNANN